MLSDDGSHILCEHWWLPHDCPSQIKNNRWAKIKADGWFFTRDGKAYCPYHIPKWTPDWKAKSRES